MAKINVVWLSGGYHLRHDFLGKVHDKFPDHERIYCDGETSLEYLLIQMGENPCFSSGKVIHVAEMPSFKNTNKKKHIDTLKARLSSLQEDNLVIFNGISPAKEKALFNHIKKIGKVYQFPDKLEVADACAWINKRMESIGKKISAEDAEFFALQCGFDMGLDGISADMLEMASRKIEKLSESKNIEKSDIMRAAIFRENVASWDILDAVDKKDVDTAVDLFDRLVHHSSDPTGASIKIINLMLWRFRLLFFLKECLSGGLDESGASEAARGLRKLSQKGSGDGLSMEAEEGKDGAFQPQWSEGAVSGVLRGRWGSSPPIDAHSRKDLYLILNALEDSVRLLRETQSETEARLLVEVLLMLSCGAMDDKHAERIRDSIHDEMLVL